MLEEPWPMAGTESPKVIWHFKQFYALREMAMRGEKGVLAALQAQRQLWEIDQSAGVGMTAPAHNGNPTIAEDQEGLAEILPKGGGGALDVALQRSRGGDKTKEEDGDGG